MLVIGRGGGGVGKASCRPELHAVEGDARQPRAVSKGAERPPVLAPPRGLASLLAPWLDKVLTVGCGWCSDAEDALHTVCMLCAA